MPDLASTNQTEKRDAAPTATACRRSPVRRWLVAAAAAALAVGVRHALESIVHEPVAWIFAYPAIVLVSLRQGFGPGLATASLCALGATLLDPSAAISARELPAQWGLFGVAAIVISLACAQARHLGRRIAPTESDCPAAPTIDTPLTRWLQAVIWGAALIPVTLFASASWWSQAEAIVAGQDRVTRANSVTVRHAERTFQTASELIRKARDLAAQPDAVLRAGHTDVRQRLQDMMLGMTAVQSIMIWDGDGRVVVGTLQNGPGAGTSIADRPYFAQARQGGSQIFITDPVRGRLSGLTVLNAVARRNAPDGSFAGVVVVSLLPGYFQDFYQSLASKESGLGTFALFKADGSVLARWPQAADGLRLPENSKLARAALTGDASGLIRVLSKFDGKPRMISFMRVDELPIYASAALDESSIFDPWRRFVLLLAGVLGPLAIGLVYVSWVALKKTRREQVVLLELQAEMRRRGQTEKALAQAQRLEALSVLTGGVAHDFNNLLAIVNGNIHMIRRKHPDVGDGRHLTAIARAVASGVRLTRQLLSFARRQALKPEQIVLQAWLPGMADLLQSTVGRSVELHIDVTPDAGPIEVDAGELELALINLATNAKDAMEQGGTLRLRAANASPAEGGAPQVTICVTDTGSGIASDLLAKVFEPFFTTKPPSKGTGLGLSQVYGFCLQAGGGASVASEVGQGTTVMLAFPVASRVVEPVERSAGPGTTERLSGRVLLVEDNPDVATAHRELLESTGVTVDVAASADEALRVLARSDSTHGLVLSDIAMPGEVDGIGLAVRLKLARPVLPVVLLTGYGTRLDDASALGCRVLAKPVDPALLLTEVERALRTEALMS